MTTTTVTGSEPAVLEVHRPWGHFQQFVQNATVTVKIITVDPGQRLSLQRHGARDEMWQALDEPLHVQVDGRSQTLSVGERAFVRAGCLHRITNGGDKPARILEIAFGHFDELDIERVEDDYARESPVPVPRLPGDGSETSRRG